MHNVGKNPKWNEAFQWEVVDQFGWMQIYVYDHENGEHDNLIGERKIKMVEFMNGSGVNKWFNITYNNNNGG